MTSTAHAQAYPLQWPPGFPRTPRDKREKGRFRTTLSAALNSLRHEVRMLGGDQASKLLVLSSNYTLGENPADTGVVAYFVYDGAQIAIPCDRWLKIEDNVKAIALTIEAMRGMERWGAKHMIRAMFTGFRAIEAPRKWKRSWREVLGLGQDEQGVVEIDAAFRAKAKKAHPDAGGTKEEFEELVAARDEALLVAGFTKERR